MWHPSTLLLKHAHLLRNTPSFLKLARIGCCLTLGLALAACGEDGGGGGRARGGLETAWHDAAETRKASEGQMLYGRPEGAWRWWHLQGSHCSWRLPFFCHS